MRSATHKTNSASLIAMKPMAVCYRVDTPGSISLATSFMLGSVNTITVVMGILFVLVLVSVVFQMLIEIFLRRSSSRCT